MAENVKFETLKNPGLLAVNYSWKPFSEEDLKKITEKIKRFSIVFDGDFFYLYGEN